MIVKEGLAEIDLPEKSFIKGPGTKTAGFYNASQRLNRDVTILFLAAKRPESVLDAFGGSGIRGIRIAKELGIEATISEINPESFRIISRNAEINHSSVDVYNESFERTLGRRLFDFVDVDPYGSVIPFVDKALTGVKNRGYVGVTATDLSALTGSVAVKTRRRYGAFLSNDLFRHEMGVRLLISYVARRAAVFDISAIPEVSFWHSHYYRCIFRVEHGAARADRVIDQVGPINKRNLLSQIYEDIDEGPMWTGNLVDRETVSRMESGAVRTVDHRSHSMLDALKCEDLSILFLESTNIARSVRSSIPPIRKMMAVLADNGMDSCRTHFSPTGLKVQGDIRSAHELMTELMKSEYR